MLHAHKLHTFLHMLVWHVYGTEPIFVYAHACNMDVLCVQHTCVTCTDVHVCSMYAAYMLNYVQQGSRYIICSKYAVCMYAYF